MPSSPSYPSLAPPDCRPGRGLVLHRLRVAGRGNGPAGRRLGKAGDDAGQAAKAAGHYHRKEDNLYIVDITPRISVFTPDGEYLRGWQTPKFANGKPSGLSFSRDGNLLVADTHYARILCYTPEGKLLENRTIGGKAGEKPGRIQLRDGLPGGFPGELLRLRVRRMGPDPEIHPGAKVCVAVGRPRQRTGQFLRPQKMAIDDQDQIWVTDACNHRVQVFDVRDSEPKPVKIWGEEGTPPANCAIPTTSCWTAKDTSICANSATTGCKNSRWQAT